MIKIETDKCNACGLCIKICHEYCLRLEGDILMVDHTVCSTCTQCIAVCPQQAITWEDYKPEQFDHSLYPGPQQIRELFMERRTIRDYSRRKIDRSILEEITGYAAYAPTHNFNFRAVIIDDDVIINQIDYLIYKSSINLLKWLYKPKYMHSLIKFISPSSEFEYLKAKPKLENVQKRNGGFKSKPVAIIMIVGDKRVPLSLESAQYALYNIDLYAQSKGIACRNLVGNQMILNRNRDFKKSIGLDKHEKIFATITMGYPAVKFRNKVIGKSINIQWNAAIN
jgi:NAD-dependent dihydropyrimidine dehydrogenase PreA subunit/nitroreductase